MIFKSYTQYPATYKQVFLILHSYIDPIQVLMYLLSFIMFHSSSSS